MPEPDVLNIVLEFTRAEQGGDPYSFRFEPQEYLLRNEGGAFKSARFPWDTSLLADLAALRRPGRDPALIQRLGETLRRFLAATKWATDESRLLAAVQAQRRVLLTIRSAAAELYSLPWELLTIESTGQHVGELPGVLLRYEWPDTHSIQQVGPQVDPRRILLAWSAAGGMVPAAEHIAAVKKAAQTAAHVFESDRGVLADASCARLSRALERAGHERQPFAVLHLLCHGGVAGSTFGIVLDSDEPTGGSSVVDAARLRQLLAPHASTLRLVVLSACDSGNSGVLGNQLGSMAQTLHRAGIAAVVASRYPLSVSGSSRLTAALYTELLANRGSLEDALLKVRQRLAEDATQLDWASLQLYARAADGNDTRPFGDARSRRLSRSARMRIAVAVGTVVALGCAGAGAWRYLHPSKDLSSGPLRPVVHGPAVERAAEPTKTSAETRPPAPTGRNIAVDHEGDILSKGRVNITAPALPDTHQTVVKTKGRIEAEGDVNIGVRASP